MVSISCKGFLTRLVVFIIAVPAVAYAGGFGYIAYDEITECKSISKQVAKGDITAEQGLRITSVIKDAANCYRLLQFKEGVKVREELEKEKSKG